MPGACAALTIGQPFRMKVGTGLVPVQLSLHHALGQLEGFQDQGRPVTAPAPEPARRTGQRLHSSMHTHKGCRLSLCASSVTLLLLLRRRVRSWLLQAPVWKTLMLWRPDYQLPASKWLQGLDTQPLSMLSASDADN